MAIDPATGLEAVVAPADNKDATLLDGAKLGDEPKTAEQLAEEKATADAVKVAAEAENKRILESEDANLSAEDLAKKPALVKAAEDKRLLDTPKDQLSAEDQVKQAALLKAQEDAKKAVQAKGAPEKYEDFKFPVGSVINQPILEEFQGLAKELDLNQEKAQRLIDLQIKHVDSFAQTMQETFQKIKDDWKAETIKELKGEAKTSLVIAGRAIEKLGTPGLRKMLNETGVGNHPELVKFFIEAGKLVSEDKVIDGKNKTAQKTDAQLFYGDTMK